MPIYRPERQRSGRYADLIGTLVRELKAGQETDSGPTADAPFIIEEPNLRGGLHVTVIWDKFDGVPKAERGKLVLDAYKEAFDEERMLTIRLALGLTREEAKELGLLDRLPKD